MPKPDRKLLPDSEPEYDIADLEHEDLAQASYDEVIDPDYAAEADPDYDEPSQEADYELSDPDYDEVVVEQVEEVVMTAKASARAGEAGFAFELGRTVLPLTQVQPHPVVWRGHLKERNPATGLVQRVPVYRLDDGYWDCYREEELQVA
jgi:hypothetical protein